MAKKMSNAPERWKIDEEVARYILDNYDYVQSVTESCTINEESWNPKKGEFMPMAGDTYESQVDEFVKYIPKPECENECDEEFTSFSDLVEAVEKKLKERKCVKKPCPEK